MGIGNQDPAGNCVTFSEDVLKIDISGPDQEHFSVIDVPGIFKKTTDGVTTEADKQMVRSMVHRYMKSPRSVILAVVPANVDVATQEILSMAEEVDKDGGRTLGVLTKPDLVDEGAEGPVIDKIEGKRHRLSLGWCIVRNPGKSQLEDSTFPRDSEERTFFSSKSPWNNLDKDKVGIDALRARLQDIDDDLIRHTFPKVKMEMNKQLKAKKLDLHKLGAQWETSSEQRSYLLDISVRFQDIVKSDLNNNHVELDEDSKLRFVNRLVKRNESFQKNMNLFGQLYRPRDDPRRSVEKDESDQTQEEAKPEPRTHEVRETKQEADLSEITIPQTIVETLPGGDTLEWLRTVYNNSRGFEVGIFSPTILGKAMQKFSTTWEGLALGYIADVITFAHAFIIESLQQICPDKRVRSGLLSVMIEELLARYRTASEQVHFLLSVERDGTPYTLSPTLNERLRESRREHLQSEMAGSSIQGCRHGTVVRMEEIGKTKDISNVDLTIQEVYNIVQAHFEVAKTRFIDNICLQAAKYSFVSGPKTPFQLFSPKFVDQLTTEQLADIAGEGAYHSMRRKELVEDIKVLEEGKRWVQ